MAFHHPSYFFSFVDILVLTSDGHLVLEETRLRSFSKIICSFSIHIS